MTRPATNEVFWKLGATKAEAEGCRLQADGTPIMVPDDNPDPARRNPAGVLDRDGGLVAMRRVILAEDNMLYRFADSRRMGTGPDAIVPVLNSPWWMEEDRMVLLLSRARTAGVGLVEMARRQLALPRDWTSCDRIVRVRPKPGVTLAAHAGPGRTAAGGAGDRRIIAREVPHLFMDQLYIPGLGWLKALNGAGPANARAWFDLGTAEAFDPGVRGLNP